MLLLTHFSNRYDGSDEESSLAVMRAIEGMAASAADLTGKRLWAAGRPAVFAAFLPRTSSSHIASNKIVNYDVHPSILM